MSLRKLGFYALLLLLATSCTKIPPVSDTHVTNTISSRTGKEVHWNREEKAKNHVNKAVHYLLSSPLTVDAAVQIALLNNQKIQGAFEELGIAQADLLQAGLFRNPVFEGFLRFSGSEPTQINPEFSVVGGFLDVFLIPLRKKVAAAEVEKTQLKVTQEVLSLAFEVQAAYFTLFTTQKKIKLNKDIVTACDAASDLSKAQWEKGNISPLEFNRKKTEFLEATLSLSKLKREALHQKEHMNILLGLQTGQLSWALQERELLVPEHEPSFENLEAFALETRLDLAEARWELYRIAGMTGLTRWWTHLNDGIGISLEKDPGGSFEFGPAFSGVLPIFNYGQADRARLTSLYRQKVALFHALKVQIGAEVRSAKEEVLLNRTLVETYQQKLLPLHKETVSMAQKFYNGMAMGTFQLLDAKIEELHVKEQLLSALKDYWVSRASLDKALGGTISRIESTQGI